MSCSGTNAPPAMANRAKGGPCGQLFSSHPRPISQTPAIKRSIRPTCSGGSRLANPLNLFAPKGRSCLHGRHSPSRRYGGWWLISSHDPHELLTSPDLPYKIGVKSYLIRFLLKRYFRLDSLPTQPAASVNITAVETSAIIKIE
jgi:hypothetical protein